MLRDPSLVLYLPLWKLDGDGIRDESAYGHRGTVTGATWTSQGRTFGGTDGVQIPANSAFQWGAGEWSWLVWIKKAYADNDYLLDQSQTADWAIRTRLVAGAFMVIFEGEATIDSDNAAYDDNVWTCAGVARNGNDCLFYKNGLLHCTEANTLTTGNVTGTDTVTVGNLKTLTTGFDGKIGEVALYNRQLTPIEMQNYFLATKRRYK